MVRVFVAVKIGEGIRQKLAALQNSLPSSAAGLKLVEPDNIHLTLKFLGEVPLEKTGQITQAIVDGVSGLQKFNAYMKGVGAFPGLNQVRVIWAGVTDGQDQFIELQRRIDAALQPLGFELEKGFHPHATIARVKFIKDKAKLLSFIKEKSGEDFGDIAVESVELKQSNLTPKGPIYSTLAEIKLL
jgi:2'-5' RNA ligase